jgi:hypothetical protein
MTQSEIQENEEYFDFLFTLQNSGVTNMFGAASYLQREFPNLSRPEAIAILSVWMENYEEIAAELKATI